eukprot:2652370-Prymnesium_polylepis.1
MASGWDSPCTHAGTSESIERSWFTTVTTSRARATASQAGSPCDPPASTQPPTALGPVPLTALAFVEGSASD